ncbi:hypothetical protein KFE98_12335 [bacterium SCSIO 12741]|nr:hypothetical protein KFE98_12335 [bacterium SCSIO 12741]
MKALLTRKNANDKQTTGTFELFDEEGKIFHAFSLELPWKDNQVRVSCIPTGNYRCIYRVSPKFGPSYLVEEPEGGHVTGRTWILIHPGNYHTQILGCILLGRTLQDINDDGYRDVTSSKATIKELIKHAPDGFSLTIVDD